MTNWFKKAADYYREVVAEMKKVTFPTWPEVRNTTAVVIVTSVIFALYLWGADQLIVWLYGGINRVFGA